MEKQNDIMIRVRDVKKKYKIGQIGGGTLRGDLQSWWARKRGKEDPNTIIGTDQRLIGTTFMALNGVSFDVHRGEAVGIIGSNGAGKSTLLKLLTHVTAPTEGDIDIYGRVASMLEVGTGFHPEMTGRENVYLNGAILGMTRSEIDAKMDEIIEFSEVGDFIDTPVKRYSSGMYVKLAFSVAAHLDSEIMIMDEVLAVGDMKFQQKCLGKMGDEAESGRTILYVSHNMATIRQLCTRCIVLDQGRIIFDGDVDEAIGIYAKGNIMTDAVNDLRELSRDANRGVRAKMLQLEFAGKSSPSYRHDEPMELKVTIHAAQDVPRAGFRVVISSQDQTHIGMADFPQFAALRAGETKDFIFTLRSGMLHSGNYSFFVALYEHDDLGGIAILDDLGRSFTFQIMDDPVGGYPWNKNCGHVRFVDATVRCAE